MKRKIPSQWIIRVTIEYLMVCTFRKPVLDRQQSLYRRLAVWLPRRILMSISARLAAHSCANCSCIDCKVFSSHKDICDSYTSGNPEPYRHSSDIMTSRNVIGSLYMDIRLPFISHAMQPSLITSLAPFHTSPPQLFSEVKSV